MEKKQGGVSRFRVIVYSVYGVLQSLSYRVPMIYGQMYMTQYLGVPIATATLVLTVAKLIDFGFSLAAGGMIQSANFRKGKYLPWMKALRWVMALGAILRMAPVRSLPTAAKAACLGLGYVMIHGSMNFMSTCQRALLPRLAGADMGERVRLTTRQTQFSSAASVVLSFGTLPLITFVGKLAGDASAGYSIVAALLAPLVILAVSLLEKAVGELDPPRRADEPLPPKVRLRDMLRALAGNDQLRVYMSYEFLTGLGGSVISGMTMYYWSIVMNRMAMHSVVSGISTCAGLAFALLIPRCGRKLGKRRAVLVNFAVMLAARILMATLALRSVWFMALANLLEKAGEFLTAIYGVNYYLDIGEYGYSKTGKDFRTLCVSMSNVPSKIAAALGGSIGGFLLARMSFDRFQSLHSAASKAGAAADWSFRQSPEFIAFSRSFIRLYALAPVVFSLLGILIFLLGYRINDEDARRYAEKNAGHRADKEK